MMNYELHVTIAPSSAADVGRFAASTGGSVLQLDLDGQGRSTQVTWRPTGGYRDAVTRMADIEAAANGEQLVVTRRKIEADRAQPPTAEEPQAKYLELHLLVAVNPEAVEHLRAIIAPFGAKLSTRFRDVVGGVPHRFVNLRAPVGRGERFGSLQAAIVDAGYRVIRVHDERVLLDSNADDDAHWLAVPETTSANV